MNNPQYLTASDLAKRYNVTRVTIWSWAKKGKLPEPIKTQMGNMWILEAIEQWDKENGN